MSVIFILAAVRTSNLIHIEAVYEEDTEENRYRPLKLGARKSQQDRKAAYFFSSSLVG
jgi:hypothetical protein